MLSTAKFFTWIMQLSSNSFFLFPSVPLPLLAYYLLRWKMPTSQSWNFLLSAVNDKYSVRPYLKSRCYLNDLISNFNLQPIGDGPVTNKLGRAVVQMLVSGVETEYAIQVEFVKKMTCKQSKIIVYICKYPP